MNHSKVPLSYNFCPVLVVHVPESRWWSVCGWIVDEGEWQHVPACTIRPQNFNSPSSGWNPLLVLSSPPFFQPLCVYYLLKAVHILWMWVDGTHSFVLWLWLYCQTLTEMPPNLFPLPRFHSFVSETVTFFSAVSSLWYDINQWTLKPCYRFHLIKM